MNNIEEHYRLSYRKLVKSMSFKANTIWAAEDIVQEAYARALKYNTGLTGKELNQWIGTILYNVFKDYLQAEGKQPQITFEEDHSEGEACPQYSKKILEEIYELIDTKSLNAIEILTNHFRYGYKANEISQITLHSYGNCRVIIHRFHQELRELYG